MAVMEGLPWALLYADALVLMAESIAGLKENVLRWKECMEVEGEHWQISEELWCY